ncbi:hypothetical protein ARMSODRAFT_801616 [Armillaria solidipes]|uniref:Uncharacterized protein n=1 Tax=Armillaria solidipes TaxID=1076256 RepID=A0A2H3B6F0_9AGAR|nr:hypothetical protein ARMSODRAFT_801616 [Armillaria solidipes]
MPRAFPTVVHLAVDFVEINGLGPMTAVTFLSFIFDLNHDNPTNASSTDDCRLSLAQRPWLETYKAISKTSLKEVHLFMYSELSPSLHPTHLSSSWLVLMAAASSGWIGFRTRLCASSAGFKSSSAMVLMSAPDNGRFRFDGSFFLNLGIVECQYQ